MKPTTDGGMTEEEARDILSGSPRHNVITRAKAEGLLRGLEIRDAQHKKDAEVISFLTNVDQLLEENAELRKENEEQARLLGMSGSREAKLLAEIERLKAARVAELREKGKWPTTSS